MPKTEIRKSDAPYRRLVQMVQSDPDATLTIPEVSALLKLHPHTVRKRIKSGALKAIRVSKSEWRVRRSDLRDYMDKLYIGPEG